LLQRPYESKIKDGEEEKRIIIKTKTNAALPTIWSVKKKESILFFFFSCSVCFCGNRLTSTRLECIEECEIDKTSSPTTKQDIREGLVHCPE